MSFAVDCLGSAGCVASTMMMYAHLPWLLASSSHSLNGVEKHGGKGRVGRCGEGWRGGATTPGGGEERAKELERRIHY